MASSVASVSHNVLAVNIFRLKTFAQLDTGAHCSIVSEQFFKNLSIPLRSLTEYDIHTLHLADGKPISVLRTAEISLKINSLIIPFEYCVLPNIAYDIILRFDFLEKHKVKSSVGVAGGGGC